MRLGVITDEIDPDLTRALEVARALVVAEVELNGLWGRNVVELTAAELARVEMLVHEAGLRVCMVSTPAFKSIVLDELVEPVRAPEVAAQMAWVRRGCELARRFGAPYVRVFSFRRCGMVGLGNPSPRLPGGGPLPDWALDRIVSVLSSAADMARESGVALAHENVRSCWGNSCRNTARILAAVDHPWLRVFWDRGNEYVSGGNPFPAGYEAARPFIVHVHLKNAVVVDPARGLTRWERIGGGDLDFRPMLERLRADGYAGAVVLETHWRGEGLTKEESTRRSWADLLGMVG